MSNEDYMKLKPSAIAQTGTPNTEMGGLQDCSQPELYRGF
jgi:hypothetical protein